MLENQIVVRPRYSETDQMGYVYYGRYAEYFEIGRTELVRELGIPYSRFEREDGIMLPVIELQVNYKTPARYDDALTITTQLKEPPTARIRFDYQIVNEQQELVVTGHVVLVFIHTHTRRPCRPPRFFLEALVQGGMPGIEL